MTAPPGVDLWQVLGGRAVGTPVGAADQDLWDRVVERLNPARARPRLRDGVEDVAQVSVRGQAYVMLRSPDRLAGYVRLTPEEWDLARRMDGETTVAALVGAFAKATGSLAPDRVVRVVADLAANRMLEELPVNAFSSVERLARGTGLRRVGSRLWAVLRGRRIVLADIDRLTTLLYRAGGRLLFTRGFAVVAALLIAAGLGLFVRTWIGGTSSLFLQDGSYAVGGLVLLGLNVLALLAHEFGHALATKHAGRRVPAIGLLVYFGIPSAFVDTTDVWMADRRHRLLATAAGPLSGLTLAGAVQAVGLLEPALAPVAFKLAFAWYLNALFNLNPLMALDGYYLAMDWLEIPNLRARGLRSLVARVRGRAQTWSTLDREERYVAAYGVASVLWTVAFLALSVRLWRDRVAGLVAGLWHTGWPGRLLLVAFVVGLFAPLVYLVRDGVTRLLARRQARRAAADHVATRPERLAALRASMLGAVVPDHLEDLADAAQLRPEVTGVVQPGGAAVPDVLVVVEGALEARGPGDAPGARRDRVTAGELVGADEVMAGRAAALEWRAGTPATLLAIPAAVFGEVVGPHLERAGGDAHAAAMALDASPALAGLGAAARARLVAHMTPVDVPPEKRLRLKDAAHGLLLSSGVLVVDDDGRELRAGEVLHSLDGEPVSAVTRTPSVVWRLRNLAALPRPAVAVAGSPLLGVHGGRGGHPPVTPPPAPPTGDGDDEADERLWRWVRRVLVLLLLFALLAVASSLAEATPWAETAEGTLLMEVVDGTASVLLDGTPEGEVVDLVEGARMVVATGMVIEVGRRSTVGLTAHGGSRQVLCGGSEAELGVIEDTPGGALAGGDLAGGDALTVPSASLVLHRGAVLADTTSPNVAWAPLVLEVDSGPVVQSVGASAFDLAGSYLEVESGEVDVVAGEATDAEVDCHGASPSGAAADGLPSSSPAPTEQAATPTPSASPSQLPSASPTELQSAVASPAPSEPAPIESSPSATPIAGPSPTPTPTSSPTSPPTSTPSPTPSPTPTPPPPPPPAFEWTTCAPSPLVVGRDGSGTTRCGLRSLDGYAGTVAITCSATRGVTCTPNVSSVTLAAGGSTFVSFAVQTTSAGSFTGRAEDPGAGIVDTITVNVTFS